MPTLWLACLLLFIPVPCWLRVCGQETLLMRLVPDNLRGRVSTTDRASELLIWVSPPQLPVGRFGPSLRVP